MHLYKYYSCSIILLRRRYIMETPKLKITQKKYKGESTVISLRLSKDMLCDIDRLSKDTGRTRNELLSVCIEFAIKNIEIVGEENI